MDSAQQRRRSAEITPTIRRAGIGLALGTGGRCCLPLRLPQWTDYLRVPRLLLLQEKGGAGCLIWEGELFSPAEEERRAAFIWEGSFSYQQEKGGAGCLIWEGSVSRRLPLPPM